MLKEAVLMGGTIMFLLATSSMMSFAMAFRIPEAISTAILGIIDNKYLILLLVNVVHCLWECLWMLVQLF